MNVARAALITALSLAPKSSTTPITGFARLRCISAGLEFTATNLDTTVSLILPYSGESLIMPTLLPIKWTLKYLKSLDTREVTMDKNTINAVTFYEGEAAGEPSPTDFPTPPDPSGYTAVQIPGLTDAVAFAFEAASVDPSRFTLNHVQVISTKKSVNVNATDGHRLYRAWLPSAGALVKRLIPAGLLEIPTKKVLVRDQFFYSDTANEQIALRVEGQGVSGWLISKGVEGTFPNCDQVTPDNGTATLQITLEPQAVLPAVKQAIALSQDGRSSACDLVIRNGALFIHPQGRDVEIPVPGKQVINGPDMIIGINGHYLRGALLELTDPTVTLRATAPGAPIWFTEGRRQFRRTIVIMPMRTAYTGLIADQPVATESIAQSV